MKLFYLRSAAEKNFAQDLRYLLIVNSRVMNKIELVKTSPQLIYSKKKTGWKDWDNMVVIGSAVSACLMHIPDAFSTSLSQMIYWYEKVKYKNSGKEMQFYNFVSILHLLLLQKKKILMCICGV